MDPGVQNYLGFITEQSRFCTTFLLENYECILVPYRFARLAAICENPYIKPQKGSIFYVLFISYEP